MDEQQCQAKLTQTCRCTWSGRTCIKASAASIPLVSSIGQVPLSWLVVVDNGDVGALGHHIHITEVAAVSDV